MVEQKENKTKDKICVSLPSEIIKTLDEKRELVPRSTFLADTLGKAWLEKEEEQNQEEEP